MLSLQKCALIWNCNYSCWSSRVHIITWDWILGFLIAKIRSSSKFASAVFSDPDWNIDRPSAPNGQHQEEVGHQNLSCHWKRLTWLQAGRKNICCKFALAVLLTIISKEPFSYKSEGVLFATSVRWLLRSFAPFEQHLSLWSCSIFCHQVHLPFLHNLDTICLTSCRATINKALEAALWKELWRGDGVVVRWFEDAGHKGWDTVVPSLSLISLSWQWELPFSSEMSVIRHPSGQDDVRKNTHDIFDCTQSTWNKVDDSSLSCFSKSHSSSCSDRPAVKRPLINRQQALPRWLKYGARKLIRASGRHDL